MAQPVPWNVRGIDPDVREAALQASRRAGMTLGQWLNSVIGETVSEHETPARNQEKPMLAPDLIPSEDPLETISRRLRELGARSSAGAMAATGALADEGELGRVSQIVEAAMARLERQARERDARTAAALGALADLIESKPGIRLANAASAPAGNPVRAMIDRLEGGMDDAKPAAPAAIEALDQRLNDIARKLDDPARAAGSKARDENIARLEAKLAGILEAINRKDDPAAAAPAPAPEHTTLQDAVADIAARQSALEGEQPPVTAPTERNLKQHIDSLTEKLGNGLAAQTIGQIKQLRGDVAALSASIENLAPRAVVEALEAAVSELSGKVAVMRVTQGDVPQFAPVDSLLEDLRSGLDALRDTSAIDALRQDLHTLSDRVAASGLRTNDNEALTALQGQMAELRQIVEKAPQPVALEGLESRIAMLATKIDAIGRLPKDDNASAGLRLAVDEVRQTLDRALPTDILLRLETRIGELSPIEGRLGELAARIEEMPGRADLDALHARMEWMHSSIVSRVAAGEPPPAPDLSAIEKMLQTLSDKIDAVQQEDDETALAAIEGQIARIAERLDLVQQDASGKQGMDEALGGLVNQFEQMHQSTIEAVTNVARGQAAASAEAQTPTGFVATIAQDLAELRQAQAAADARTQSTLDAVNEALGKIVARLSLLEVESATRPAAGDTVPAKPVPAEAPTSAPTAAPELDKAGNLRRGMLRSMARTAPAQSMTMPEPAAPVAPDAPIEPGSGRPEGIEPRSESSADSLLGADKSSFIAAARRAARAAQEQSEEALQVHRAVTAEAKSSSGGLRAAIASRKKLIVVGLAATLIGIVAVQAINAWRADNPLPTPEQGAPAEVKPAPEKQSRIEDAPRSGLAAMMAAKPDAADPVQVGSLGTPPGPLSGGSQDVQKQGEELPDLPPAAASRLAALTPLATAVAADRLRTAALAGEPAALYEVGVRYVEGRNLPRDPAAGAKFLEAAADQGLAPAQYRLGSLYREGRGVAADKAKALEWFKRAAENGNARAMHNVGVLLAEGVAGQPDYPGALFWFSKAAELNVRDSEYNLAILYGRGLGAQQDLGASYRWFSAAAKQGDEDAGKKRDDIAARLTPEQLAKAKAAIKAWQPKPLDPHANDVAAPAEGWDAPIASQGKTRGGRG